MKKRKSIATDKLSLAIKEKVDNFMKKLSSNEITDEFKQGFKLGRDFTLMTSTLFDTIRLQVLILIPESGVISDESKKVIELNEKLQMTFFGEVININDYLIEEDIEEKNAEKSDSNIQ